MVMITERIIVRFQFLKAHIRRKSAACLKHQGICFHHTTSALSVNTRDLQKPLLGKSLFNLQPLIKATMSTHGPSDRLKGIQENIWVEFVQLALECKPVNLGQGFPDFAAPPHVAKALADAVLSQNVLLNQYTRGFGHPRLVNVLSRLFSELMGHPIDPQKEIMVSVGAYQALYCTFMGLLNPGDEVIIMEPYFDCYEPMALMAGAVPVFIPLRPVPKQGHITSADWVLEPEELESKFTSKTKMIVVNTPHNPLGKVFTLQELEMIANLAKKYNVIVVMDEVYEWIVYNKTKHIRMASLPDMWERTLTIGSAGKTFSVTGWKLGWAIGPAHLMKGLQLLHQNCVYTCPTPIQEAVAVGFEHEMNLRSSPDGYWNQLSSMLEGKRDKLAHVLASVAMNPVIPEGSYFMIADFSELGAKFDTSSEQGNTKDHKFVRWLSKNKKLQGIPLSAFYSPEHKYLAEKYIRFCFIKEDSTLEAAAKILEELKQSLT